MSELKKLTFRNKRETTKLNETSEWMHQMLTRRARIGPKNAAKIVTRWCEYTDAPHPPATVFMAFCYYVYRMPPKRGYYWAQLVFQEVPSRPDPLTPESVARIPLSADDLAAYLKEAKEEFRQLFLE